MSLPVRVQEKPYPMLTWQQLRKCSLVLYAYDRAKHLTDSLGKLETLSRLARWLSPSHVVLFTRFLDLIPLIRMPLALYSYTPFILPSAKTTCTKLYQHSDTYSDDLPRLID